MGRLICVDDVFKKCCISTFSTTLRALGLVWLPRRSWRQSDWMDYPIYGDLGTYLLMHYLSNDTVKTHHGVGCLDQITAYVWSLLFFLCCDPFFNLVLVRSKSWSTGNVGWCYQAPFYYDGIYIIYIAYPISLKLKPLVITKTRKTLVYIASINLCDCVYGHNSLLVAQSG